MLKGRYSAKYLQNLLRIIKAPVLGYGISFRCRFPAWSLGHGGLRVWEFGV